MAKWKSTGQVMTSINKENLTSDVSENRCETCKKKMLIVDGSDFCFTCSVIASEDEQLAKDTIKEREERLRKDRLKMFDEDSLMNPKLKSATFENYEPTNDELKKAKEIARRFAQNFNKEKAASVLFIGTYGTGKSHLSVAITKELMTKDHSCLFISTPKLLTKLRSTYNKESAFSEEQVISQLSNVDCLVLDDIGAEQTKVNKDGNDQTWATSKLFEVIDSRIGKHTVFTSNFQPHELQQRLGGRNYSRMMEDVFIVPMNGKDYRTRNFE
jgi:DNA replication protein DnaC